MRPRFGLTLVILGWTLAGLPPVDAQVRPVYDLGAAGLSQVLERLQTTASVLHTGAHPDDEDSAFIARVARGDHARVAYLALNRGEGGQNIIGTELFEALGVIRSEELLQARRLDGGEQFFTRTLDYGFSKTRAEAAAKWNERDVLDDMVRVIRTFRPLVVSSRFSGTPSDGHGQHQLAGYLTPLAVKAAADPNEFPEQLNEGLRPWQTKKLYRHIGGRPDGGSGPTMQVQTGVVDPVIGRSYAAIAAEGRSQHKSQEMGSIEPLGPSASSVRFIDGIVAATSTERSVFDGVDTSIAGLATLAGLPAGTLRAELLAMQTAAAKALKEYEPLEPAKLTATLVGGLRATRAAREALKSAAGSAAAHADADALLGFKEEEFADAVTRAAGITSDPLASDETVVPGGTLDVTARLFAVDPAAVRVVDSEIRGPAGWKIEAVSGGNADTSSRRETPAYGARYRVTVPADAAITQPYFLTLPRDGDKYRWPMGAPKGRPFDAPLLTNVVTVDIGGVSVPIARPVQYRMADRVRGELRRDVNVVPNVGVGLDTHILIVPLGGGVNQQRLVVRATNFSSSQVSGTLRLRMPAGWTSSPASVPFTLRAKADSTSTPFMITAPAGRVAGKYDITAEATLAGTSFSSDVRVIAYPHIQTHRLYSPALAASEVFDIKVAPVRVGYIMGSGDQVPEALRRIGVDVTMINEEMLATGDLSRFDTIVVGIRASEARPDFVANNTRLVQYMERGGTLIVQYQQQEYTALGLAPYTAGASSNSRVTEETAPVRILAPKHPVFTFPNVITAADFDGWVQERNLYAFETFDAKYTPLLESADKGEAPQRGAELYADVGKGRYVYTAYSWFRQLPAGVPGAYRQFANLISLPKAPK